MTISSKKEAPTENDLVQTTFLYVGKDQHRTQILKSDEKAFYGEEPAHANIQQAQYASKLLLHEEHGSHHQSAQPSGPESRK